MQLYDWNIITNTDKRSYVIGITEENRFYSSAFLTHTLDYTLDYIMIETETNVLKLYHKEYFKPTYYYKRLYDWSIEYTSSDKYDFKSLKDIEDTVLGKSLIGYRDIDDCEYDTDSLYYTTPVVKVILNKTDIQMVTENGSTYLLDISDTNY